MLWRRRSRVRVIKRACKRLQALSIGGIMNYRLLATGLFFLFNPDITILDLLPDCIGFYLIAKALSNVAEISPPAEKAVACFRKLAWIGVGKAFAFFPMMSLFQSEKEITLLFTGGFSLLTAVFLFPAFHNLFAFITQFALRANTNVRGTRVVAFVSYIAFILRFFLAMVPESVYLYMDTYESISQNRPIYPLAPYRMGITVLAVTISFVIGLVWLVSILRYLSGVKRNRALNERLHLSVSFVVHSQYQTVMTSLKPSMRLMMLSFLFLIGYSIEGTPVFPDFLAPLMLLFSLSYLKRCLWLPKQFKLLPILASISGLFSFLATYLFCEQYYEKATIGFLLVRSQYLLPIVLTGVTSLTYFLSVLIVAVPALKRLINEHTGAFWETAYTCHNSAVAKERQNLHFRVALLPWLTLVCLTLGVVSFALYYVHPLLRLLSAGLGLCLYLYTHTLFSSIQQSVKEKYAGQATE